MNNGKKVRILFVDDEQKILDGLRRMLYGMRNEWEMEFINSGQKALEIMGKNPIDVIVSDMRMPEMDGAELLNKIKQIYPKTIRFILSGYSDKDMILRTIDAADQFLSKPCSSDILKEAIQKSIGFTGTLDKAKIHEFISKIQILPALPDLYKQLINLVESDKSSAKEIAEIVKKDVIMTAKILQLVNSAFFGLPNRICDIYQAVSYLGMDTIKSIVITVKAFGEFSKEEMDRFHLDNLYQHSCNVGILSGKIINSISTDQKLFEEAIISGILHDIGKIIFIKNKPEIYNEIYKEHIQDGIPLYMLENQHFGINHAEVGGCIMETWGFSKNSINSIIYHHSFNPVLENTFNCVSSVYFANILEKRPEYFNEIDITKPEIKYLQKLDILGKLPEWIKYTKCAEEKN